MSYVLVEDVPATWERYEPIARSLGSGPRGLLLHVAGPTDEGFRIVEVWETEADWVAFSESLELAVRAVDPAFAPHPVLRTFSTLHVVIKGFADGAEPPGQD
jgi:hypothetical protein